MSEESRPKRSAPEEADDGDRKRSALEEGTTNDDDLVVPPKKVAEEPISLANVSSKEAANTFTELMTLFHSEDAWFREETIDWNQAEAFLERLERDLTAFPEIAKVTSIYEEEEKSLLTAFLRIMFEALQLSKVIAPEPMGWMPECAVRYGYHWYTRALNCLIRPNPHALLWCELNDWQYITPDVCLGISEHFSWVFGLVLAKWPDKNPVHFGFHSVDDFFSRYSQRWRRFDEPILRKIYGRYPNLLLEKDNRGRVPLQRVVILKHQSLRGFPTRISFPFIQWMIEACPESLQARSSSRNTRVEIVFQASERVLDLCIRGMREGRGLSDEEFSQQCRDIRELCNMLLGLCPDVFGPHTHRSRPKSYCDKVRQHIDQFRKWEHWTPALEMTITLMRIQLHLEPKTRPDYKNIFKGDMRRVNPLCSFCDRVDPLLQEESKIIKEREVLRKAAVLMEKYTPPASEGTFEEEEEEDSSQHHLWSTVYQAWLKARLACKASEIPRVRSIRASIKTVQGDYPPSIASTNPEGA